MNKNKFLELEMFLYLQKKKRKERKFSFKFHEISSKYGNQQKGSYTLKRATDEYENKFPGLENGFVLQGEKSLFI